MKENKKSFFLKRSLIMLAIVTQVAIAEAPSAANNYYGYGSWSAWATAHEAIYGPGTAGTDPEAPAPEPEPEPVADYVKYKPYTAPEPNSEATSSPYTQSGLQTTAQYGTVQDGDGFRYNQRRGIIGYSYDMDVSQNTGLNNLDNTVANVDNMTAADLTSQTDQVNSGVYGATGAPGEGDNTGNGTCEQPVALLDKLSNKSDYKKIAYYAYLHKKKKEYVARSYRLLAQVRMRIVSLRQASTKAIEQNSETNLAQAANIEAEAAIISAKTATANAGAIIYDDIEKDALDITQLRKRK